MNESQNPSRNISLIIGLAIPVVLTLFIAINIYIPRWFVTIEPPQTDFLYRTQVYPSNPNYRVYKGRLQKGKQSNDPANSNSESRIYVHHVAGNYSEELSFADASTLNLVDSETSPDGYHLEWGKRNSWLPLFDSPDYRRRYLVKDHHAVALNLAATDGSYYNMQLLGWIVNPDDPQRTDD